MGTYQSKILVTAILSVTLLRKPLKRVQWLAISIMAVGIAIVQLSKAREAKKDTMANNKEQQVLVGFLGLALAAFCSAFAGIITEMIFKHAGIMGSSHEKTSLWLQNMQMATYSLPIVALAFLFGSRSQLATVSSVRDIYSIVSRGFTVAAWVAVVLNAIGGLLTALVIKYADNILRGFATAISTANSLVLSTWCFGLEVHLSFYGGAVMVIFSTMLYGGIVSLPGNWWNTVPSLCGLTPPSITEQELKKVEKSDCLPASGPPAQFVGQQVCDEGAKFLNSFVKGDKVIHPEQGDEVIHPEHGSPKGTLFKSRT